MHRSHFGLKASVKPLNILNVKLYNNATLPWCTPSYVFPVTSNDQVLTLCQKVFFMSLRLIYSNYKIDTVGSPGVRSETAAT